MASIDSKASEPVPKDGAHGGRYRQTLDPSLLNLDPDELAFFKDATGIQDEAGLKENILSVQEKAFAVYPYPCIRNFNFTKLKISRLTAYPAVMQLAKERPDGILIDLGCCFGNDARKAIRDEYPMKNVIASDLRPEFWELGHKLFQDTAETFPIPFFPGDIFDASFISPTPVTSTDPPPPLCSVKTLTQLQGSISVIHASSFFHLFGEQQQETLAHLVASLLSPLSGSIVFGMHGGAEKPTTQNDRGTFAHSPESWKELWEGVLGKEKCRVEASLNQRAQPMLDANLHGGAPGYTISWSVTRL